MYTLFIDSDCDITRQEAESNGARFISMPYSYNGKTVYPYVDYDVFDCHAFYDMLRGDTIPTTSSISEEMYYNYFKPEFEAGKDILYPHFSAAMTNTFDNMQKAVDRLLAEYPERKFYHIDTKGITIISGNICWEIIDMYKEGKCPEEIIEWAKEEIYHFAQYFFADDLKFFKKSGRVSNLAATMGTLIGIRPLITMSEKGTMDSIGTVKGRIKAMEKLVSYVEELGDEIEKHRVIIGHSDVPELAEELAHMLTEKFGKLNIMIVEENPTTGSHCGPNGIGVSFHSKHR